MVDAQDEATRPNPGGKIYSFFYYMFTYSMCKRQSKPQMHKKAKASVKESRSFECLWTLNSVMMQEILSSFLKPFKNSARNKTAQLNWFSGFFLAGMLFVLPALTRASFQSSSLYVPVKYEKRQQQNPGTPTSAWPYRQTLAWTQVKVRNTTLETHRTWRLYGVRGTNVSISTLSQETFILFWFLTWEYNNECVCPVNLLHPDQPWYWKRSSWCPFEVDLVDYLEDASSASLTVPQQAWAVAPPSLVSRWAAAISWLTNG